MAWNDLIFQALSPDLDLIRRRFKKEFALVITRANKKSLKQPMNLWLQLSV
jgi:hypothetical protein